MPSPTSRVFGFVIPRQPRRYKMLPSHGMIIVIWCVSLKYRLKLTLIAYDHTTLNIPVLVRSPKSSSVGPG